MRTYGIIPARLGSSRLPRKMLLAETGKPLLQYAWEAASRASSLDEVLIATDSEEIAAAARAFGARVELTAEHPSGSDRIAEVVRRACGDAEIIVNIQGDEPEVDPATIDRLAQSLRSHPDVEMATLAAPIRSTLVLEDRSCVKVVRAADGRALYFSRLPIPYYRDGKPEDLMEGEGVDFGFSISDFGLDDDEPDDSRMDESEISNLKSEISDSHAVSSSSGSDTAATQSKIQNPKSKILTSPWLLHIGLYAYRREFLLAFTEMPQSRLERLESLEQLRALEAGASIHVEVVPHRTVGIDTPDDYARFVARQLSVNS